jgi:hypothetical protein
VSDRFVLDPDAVLDFAFDWSSWLGAGEHITAHTITAPAGLTVQSHSETGGIVTVWLTGGVVPAVARLYLVTCHVTTNEGRQDDRSIRVDVRNR